MGQWSNGVMECSGARSQNGKAEKLKSGKKLRGEQSIQVKSSILSNS
jgi:hypothetical protein